MAIDNDLRFIQAIKDGLNSEISNIISEEIELAVSKIKERIQANSEVLKNAAIDKILIDFNENNDIIVSIKPKEIDISTKTSTSYGITSLVEVIPAPIIQRTNITFSSFTNISRALRGGINEFLPDNIMQVTYPINEAEGGIAVPVNYSEHVVVGFDILFESPYDFPQGQKIFRIQSFNSIKGINNWDVILVACGGSSQNGSNSMVRMEAARNGGSWWGEVAFGFSLDTWHKVRIYLKKGTLYPEKSGSLIVKVDDRTLLNLPNVEVIRGNGSYADGPINTLHFGGWFSNGANGNIYRNPDSLCKYRMKNAFHSSELLAMNI